MPAADRLVQAPRRPLGCSRGDAGRAGAGRRDGERGQHRPGRRVGRPRGGCARRDRGARHGSAHEAGRGGTPRRPGDSRAARGLVADDARSRPPGRAGPLHPPGRGSGGDGGQRHDRARAVRGARLLRHGRHPLGRGRPDDGNRQRGQGLPARRAGDHGGAGDRCAAQRLLRGRRAGRDRLRAVVRRRRRRACAAARRCGSTRRSWWTRRSRSRWRRSRTPSGFWPAGRGSSRKAPGRCRWPLPCRAPPAPAVWCASSAAATSTPKCCRGSCVS